MIENILAVSILNWADARIEKNATENRKFHKLLNVSIATIERISAAVAAPIELLGRLGLTLLGGLYSPISTRFVKDISQTLKPTGMAFFQALGALPKVFAPATQSEDSEVIPQEMVIPNQGDFPETQNLFNDEFEELYRTVVDPNINEELSNKYASLSSATFRKIYEDKVKKGYI